MAAATAPPTIALFALLIDHENTVIGQPFHLEISHLSFVSGLKNIIKTENARMTSHVDASNLILWKLIASPVVSPARAQQNAFIKSIVFPDPDSEEAFEGNGVVQCLDPSKQISYYWEASADWQPERLRIIAQIPFVDRPKRGLETQDTENVKRQKLGKEAEASIAFNDAQELDIENARMACPPSSAAAVPRFLHEQGRRPVCNGRPYTNYGLPIGLFHPIFNKFHAAMNISKPFTADAKTYSLVRAFLKASAEIYSTKEQRIAALDPGLKELIGKGWVVIEKPGVKSDGVIVTGCGSEIVYVAIREVKNEIGTAGTDPYNQGSLSYRKYWAAETHDTIRRHSRCPSIILAIAGPWLCVLGGVYLDKVVIQPLTDYVWLGGDIFNDGRLLFVTRLFAALKSAISDLSSYYNKLKVLTGPSINNSFPFITKFGSKKFTYQSRLVPNCSNKLLYRAELDSDNRTVVVKFASKYNADAHRILAKHNLAPALHYSGTDEADTALYGGRYMIVMDFIKEHPGPLNTQHFERISQAIKILHSEDLVFGDLREPNIMITDEKNIMLIDFDWCGPAKITYYPASLNPDSQIGWPEGVEPDAVMEKKHDLDLLNKLQHKQSLNTI